MSWKLKWSTEQAWEGEGVHHSCTQGQADLCTSVMWALSMICCWSPLAVPKAISAALTLSWSSVPLPDCLDMVEWASVDVDLSILDSSIIPATGHHEEHPVPEPHCKMSSHLNCAPFGSQDLLPFPMVVPGCSLATHNLPALLFVLFPGLGCTDSAQCQPQVKHPGEFSRNGSTKMPWHVLARDKAKPSETVVNQGSEEKGFAACS